MNEQFISTSYSFFAKMEKNGISDYCYPLSINIMYIVVPSSAFRIGTNKWFETIQMMQRASEGTGLQGHRFPI